MLNLSPRKLTIDWGADFAIITPVPRCYLERLQILLETLQSQWLEGNYFCDRCMKIADRIANLCPRADIDGFGFPCAEIPQMDLEKIFIGVIEGEAISPCYLLQLHTFKTKEAPVPQSAEITPADIPIPSSGIESADLFARLVALDDSIEGAMQLWQCFDGEFLNCLVGQINELRRDPEDRMKEYLRSRLDDWKQQNRGVYEKALGL